MPFKPRSLASSSTQSLHLLFGFNPFASILLFPSLYRVSVPFFRRSFGDFRLVVVVFERRLSPTGLAGQCLQTFSVVFVTRVKIATFEPFKPLEALCFTKSMLLPNALTSIRCDSDAVFFI